MSSLIGIWLYTSLIYQGQPIPRPNPALQIYYTFESHEINEIFYYRTGEEGFCKRKAKYQIKDNEIEQTVISVDENNAGYCGQDTDMQVGFTSRTKFEIIDDALLLHLPLGEETLIYVWKKSETRSIEQSIEQNTEK